MKYRVVYRACRSGNRPYVVQCREFLLWHDCQQHDWQEDEPVAFNTEVFAIEYAQERAARWTAALTPDKVVWP